MTRAVVLALDIGLGVRALLGLLGCEALLHELTKRVFIHVLQLLAREGTDHGLLTVGQCCRRCNITTRTAARGRCGGRLLIHLIDALAGLVARIALLFLAVLVRLVGRIFCTRRRRRGRNDRLGLTRLGRNRRCLRYGTRGRRITVAEDQHAVRQRSRRTRVLLRLRILPRRSIAARRTIVDAIQRRQGLLRGLHHLLHRLHRAKHQHTVIGCSLRLRLGRRGGLHRCRRLGDCLRLGFRRGRRTLRHTRYGTLTACTSAAVTVRVKDDPLAAGIALGIGLGLIVLHLRRRRDAAVTRQVQHLLVLRRDRRTARRQCILCEESLAPVRRGLQLQLQRCQCLLDLLRVVRLFLRGPVNTAAVIVDLTDADRIFPRLTVELLAILLEGIDIEVVMCIAVNGRHRHDVLDV